MVNYKRVLFLSFFLCISADLRAQDPWPDRIPELLSEAHRSILGIKLERAAGADIVRKLGTTQPVLLDSDGHKDETHGPYSYCYRSESSPDTYLSFQTGGSENPMVFEYRLERGKEKPGCSVSAVLDAKVQTDGGVRLGMDKDTFTKLFPGTPKTANDAVTYDYAKLVKYDVPKQTPWNRDVKYTGEWHYATVVGLFKDNKLAELSISAGGEMDW